ncbi:MAG TPA: uroporphyrinogen-III C-methyltransferase [Abditibacteriaceae bacterium]|jgi:uroporphyrinogen III methyltransferase/synthase|nr:uroporphyrinogen-III C-methyltransferase [Abditibacteriaceae bacterium]
MNGIVYLVGAGPGDPKLITVGGREALRRADVVVYDRLIGAALLDECRADAEKIFVGKEAARHAMQQDDINRVLVERAKQGKIVCRLKGGDPFVFGRGGEEALFCRASDVRFEIIPGVTSSIAAPAYAGIPVTQRADENFVGATSFAVVTGHTKDDDAPPPTLPVADTIVFLMGVRALPKIVSQLKARGDKSSTRIALVRWGTTSQQQVVAGTLDTIEDEVARSGLKPPALIVVGEVVGLRERLQWFDNRPLWGKNVVVTRAREQASSLVEELDFLGANVVQCPTIRVEDLDDYSVADNAICTLHDFDWVVFTSTNGVKKFWERLGCRGKDSRVLANAKVAAIGPATSEALRTCGIVADFVPESSISEDVARGLIELGVQNEKVLIARAQEGREVLEEALRGAGNHVEVAPLYRTVPDVSNADSVREMLHNGEIDWVSFTSSSTVKNFVEAIGADTISSTRNSFRVAVIGPVTEQTARDHGLVPDVVAANADVKSLAQAICKATHNS